MSSFVSYTQHHDRCMRLPMLCSVLRCMKERDRRMERSMLLVLMADRCRFEIRVLTFSNLANAGSVSQIFIFTVITLAL